MKEESNEAPMLRPDSPDDDVTFCRRDCLIGRHCVTQRKVSSRVQRIDCQLTGPEIAGRLKCLTMYTTARSDLGVRRVRIEFLRTLALTCVT